jgi:hypothetical protein
MPPQTLEKFSTLTIKQQSQLDEIKTQPIDEVATIFINPSDAPLAFQFACADPTTLAIWRNPKFDAYWISYIKSCYDGDYTYQAQPDLPLFDQSLAFFCEQQALRYELPITMSPREIVEKNLKRIHQQEWFKKAADFGSEHASNLLFLAINQLLVDGSLPPKYDLNTIVTYAYKSTWLHWSLGFIRFSDVCAKVGVYYSTLANALKTDSAPASIAQEDPIKLMDVATAYFKAGIRALHLASLLMHNPPSMEHPSSQIVLANAYLGEGNIATGLQKNYRYASFEEAQELLIEHINTLKHKSDLRPEEVAFRESDFTTSRIISKSFCGEAERCVTLFFEPRLIRPISIEALPPKELHELLFLGESKGLKSGSAHPQR